MLGVRSLDPQLLTWIFSIFYLQSSEQLKTILILKTDRWKRFNAAIVKYYNISTAKYLIEKERNRVAITTMSIVTMSIVTMSTSNK